jgi:hypothetical protein
MTQKQNGAPARGTQPLAEMLSAQAARVRELERTADACLHENGDIEAYTASLQAKAELLSEIFDRARPYLDALSEEQDGEIAEKLHNFAHSAEQALEVDSIFFMRQLLYPEDYQEGEENDLERLISFLQGDG